MNIKLKDLLKEEGAAAKAAKAKGLKSKGFGNWADSSGKVVAQTKDDKLVMTKKAKEPSEKKSKKKKAKDTGDVGGPAHPNVPKKDSKKKDVKKKVDKPTKEKPSKEEPKKEKPKKEKPSKEEPKKEKPKKEKPKKKKWTPKDGEANRPVSKAQKKREAKAKPKTVHDRGNGHFAGKNPDGNVQGFHGDYAEEQAELYSQGEAPSKKKAKALKYKKDLKKAGWDPNDKSGKSAFAMDGGGTAWDEMMDGETPSKNWWADLMDSFAKEAGELETK